MWSAVITPDLYLHVLCLLWLIVTFGHVIGNDSVKIAVLSSGAFHSDSC